MATKINCLRYAQDWANRKQKHVVIYQCDNGQWLHTECNEQTMSYKKAEVLAPQANYNKFKSPRQLTSSEYRALLDLYNNCNDAYRTLSEEWKYAFVSRLYSK